MKYREIKEDDGSSLTIAALLNSGDFPGSTAEFCFAQIKIRNFCRLTERALGLFEVN